MPTGAIIDASQSPSKTAVVCRAVAGWRARGRRRGGNATPRHHWNLDARTSERACRLQPAGHPSACEDSMTVHDRQSDTQKHLRYDILANSLVKSGWTELPNYRCAPTACDGRRCTSRGRVRAAADNGCVARWSARVSRLLQWRPAPPAISSAIKSRTEIS